MVPDLLRDLLLRQTQRSVRRAGVTMPPCPQLRLTPPRHADVNASLCRCLLHLREGHVLSRGSLCHSHHLPAPTHIHRHDGSLRRVVACRVVPVNLQHGLPVVVPKRFQLSVPTLTYVPNPNR